MRIFPSVIVSLLLLTGAAFGANFDGDNDFIQMGSTAILNTDNPFSATWWFYHDDAAGTWESMLSLLGTTEFNYLTGDNGTYPGYFGFRGQTAIKSTGALSPANTALAWHHMVITYNGGTKGSAASWACYLDGASVSLTTANTFGPVGNTNRIGGDAGGEYFNGSIPEVMVFDYAMTATEAANLYTAGLKPVDTLTVVDWSGNGNDGTNVGATSGLTGPDWNYDFVAASSTYIDIGTNALLNTDNPFTVMCDVYLDSGLTWRSAFSLKGTTEFNYMTGDNGTYPGGLGFRGRKAIITTDPATFDPTNFAGSWRHLVVGYNGGNKDLASSFVLYLDGVSVGLTEGGTTFGVVGNANRIGGNQNNEYWDGRIRDVWVYDSLLTSNQVYNLYNGTEPTNALIAKWTMTPPVKEPASHWKDIPGYQFGETTTNGTVVPDLTGNVDGSASNGVTLETSVPSVVYTATNTLDWVGTNHSTVVSGPVLKNEGGYWHWDFDGSDDYITTKNISPTSSVTVAAWMRPDAALTPAGAQDYVVDCIGDSSDGWVLSLYNNGGTPAVEWAYYSANNPQVMSKAYTLTVGEWYYVVGVHDTDTNEDRLYINGQEQSAGYRVGGYLETIDPTTKLVTLGTRATLFDIPYNGDLARVTVWNNIALSTAQVTNNYDLGILGNITNVTPTADWKMTPAAKPSIQNRRR